MKRLPRLALATALFAGALAGIPSLAFAGNLPAAIDGSVAVMHTNDIHGRQVQLQRKQGHRHCGL